LRNLRYLAIEGVIGVGKTSLAKKLAERLDARLILDKPEENPFLPDFYREPRRYAFQTQLFFLLSRFRQQEEIPQWDLFHSMVITDYLFERDHIFATLNLDDRELILYNRIASLLRKEVPVPDLVVYLQSSPARLLANIRRRNLSYEKNISEDYLRSLCEAYNRYFFHYNHCPLLVVNATEIDFVNREKDFEDLVREILRPHRGIEFYSPIPG
jgi:deoxyadenosine/deoxycytidine kinase